MPSMRLNTQANAGIADPTEWQTVSTKAKAKTRTKSEEDVGQAAGAQSRDAVLANGTKLPESIKPAVPAARPPPGASRQYQPEELGFEVLAAYDQAWAASTSPPKVKNPPPVVEPAFTPAPAPQVQPEQPAKESKKAKKKAKAKANAAAPATEAAPTNGASKEPQNGKANGNSAPKQAQQAAGKKASAPAANGAKTASAAKSTTAARSMPKAPATVAAASAQVDLKELAEHVASSKSKHPKDGVLQLQLLASWLARTFSGVSYHLSVVIEKAGVNAAIAQPWGDAVEPLQKALLQYTGECHADDVARFVFRVCEQTIAALPEKGGAQTDIGELLVLAAACRSRPLAIALVSQSLCPLRSKILSPGRVPVSLWLLGQAASAGGNGAACAVHAWSRVVLPTITYQEVTLTAKGGKKASGKAAAKQPKSVSVYHIEPAARDSALSFFKDVLLADKASVHRSALKKAARAGVPVGTDGAGEPIVPASAVSSAEAAASGAISTARGTADALSEITSDLADLCDCCRNPNVVAAAVLRALTTADAAAQAEDAEALLPATKALVGQLWRHGDIAGQAWGKEHRNKLAGSTAILEQLAAETSLLSPLLNAPLGNDTMLNALDGLEKAQASIINSTKDTPAKELALRANKAARSLSFASINVMPASARWSLFSILLLGGVTVAMSMYSPKHVEGVLEPVVGAQRAAVVTSSCQTLVSNVGGFCAAMWDAWTGNEDSDRASYFSR